MAIEGGATSAYVVPTDRFESDGTFGWDSTTLMVAEVEGGGQRGLGYTYANRSITTLIAGVLAPALDGCDALDVPAAWTSDEESALRA